MFSVADAFYLMFYPFTYIATVIIVRGEVRKLATPSWLDGAVGGLGAAAVCAVFAFPAILQFAGGTPVETATDLAYPVADLLLLGLAVGGSTVMSGRRRAPWILLAGGLLVMGIGDTFHLLASLGDGQNFALGAIAFPASILVLSISVWLRPQSSDPLLVQKPSTFIIPGLSTAAALAILFVGNLRSTGSVALGLATATLLLVGVRLALTVRGMNALSQERSHQSVTDDLTGLANRRRLFSVLDAFFADYDTPASRPRLLAFLFVDLDRFKAVNDTFGHSAGDQVLKQLGPRLSAGLRESDLLVRLGGDEFVVLLLDSDADYAATVARRLTEVLEEPFILDNVRASISASIGIALVPSDATDSGSLVRCADIAMFRAKTSGVPWVIHQSELDNSGNRLLLYDELRTAIEQRQLFLHYQPQIDLRTGRVAAVESLIRWDHPRLGIVPPDEFLPFSEEAGLMGAITRFVLTEALTQCAAWRHSGEFLTVAVNISATDLLDTQFVNLICDLLENHGVPAEALVLEITETSIIAEFDRSQQVIQELHDLGIIVSIDDFGAGFTSLAHLSSLAVKELKLDLTFIRRLAATKNERDVELVRGTIELGHALGLRIVAEGIEERSTLELLTRLGCDVGQGYFIGRPKPAQHLALTTPTRALNA